MEDLDKILSYVERGTIIVGILFSIFTTQKSGFDIRAAVDALSALRVIGKVDNKPVELTTEGPKDDPKT